MQRKHWKQGPTCDAVVPAHQRPINVLCKKDEDTIITGSQDHSCKVIKVSEAIVERELYNKKYGHKEWITSIAYSDVCSKIITAAMDSKICIWETRGPVKCIDLIGHLGSIISSSYDKSIKIWSLQNNNCMNTLQNTKLGHDKAIQTFLWNNSLICSGGRDGLICMWDIQTGDLIAVGDEHKAPISCIISDELNESIITGGMDGNLNVWDLRTANRIGFVEYAIKSGSVNDMKQTNDGNFIIICGSDKTIKVLDARKNYEQVFCLRDHQDVISQIQLANDDELIVSCGLNGWILVHDISQNGKCLYGANGTGSISNNGNNIPCNAIQVMEPNYLVSAGEDGAVVIFDYK
ncbi:hypothetical protein ABK040_007087 [Willaertia magna]